MALPPYHFAKVIGTSSECFTLVERKDKQWIVDDDIIEDLGSPVRVLPWDKLTEPDDLFNLLVIASVDCYVSSDNLESFWNEIKPSLTKEQQLKVLQSFAVSFKVVRSIQ